MIEQSLTLRESGQRGMCQNYQRLQLEPNRVSIPGAVALSELPTVHNLDPYTESGNPFLKYHAACTTPDPKRVSI